MPVISVGDKLDGKYVIARRLGGGAYGEVFLATDNEVPDRQVAIKALSPAREDDDSPLKWEMQKLAQFSHPHVVGFYHHFPHEGRLCLVMEYCSGGSLFDRLMAAGHFSEQKVFAWGAILCDTLAAVHAQGIVHHDIKPMNILFTADGTIKLGDFGIANMRTGTLIYMPPERVSRTDPRADIYALGLTLLELLTGIHPFVGLQEDEALRARMRHDFIPTDLPRWVQEVLLKATHPTPEMRFQTAADFAQAIRAKHVPYVFDGNRIKAAALARKAEAAIRCKKWRTAEKLVKFALAASPDCVAALLAGGRCQLMLQRTELASEHFSKALAISPWTPVHKELGWIRMEQGRLPAAISLLTDHLQRNASDYEAYNLLLKCFYLTGRYEAAESLARTLIAEKAPSTCFRSNDILCGLLAKMDLPGGKLTSREAADPFIAYNSKVFGENPPAWGEDKPPLKSKLLFEEYRFGSTRPSDRENVLVVHMSGGSGLEFKTPIVTIGSLAANDIVLSDGSVSRRHCAMVNYRDDVWLYDLASSVGTVVDGQRLVGRMLLEGVHNVQVGRVCLRVDARKGILT